MTVNLHFNHIAGPIEPRADQPKPRFEIWQAMALQQQGGTAGPTMDPAKAEAIRKQQYERQVAALAEAGKARLAA